MPRPKPSRVRLLLYLLYAVALLALARAAVIVPGQVHELWLLRGGIEAYEGEPIPLAGDARLEGRLVEAWTGQALAEVGLELVRFPAREPVAEGDPDWAPSPAGALRSGGDGSFGMDVAPGFYRIRIDDPGYYSSDGYQVVVGDGGQTPAPLVIAAHRLCTLEVVIEDESGAGVAGAAVFIKDGDPGRAFYTPQRNGMATTDGNGEAQWRRRCGPAMVRRVELPGERVHYIERPITVEQGALPFRLSLAEIEAAPPWTRAPQLVRRPEDDTGAMLSISRDREAGEAAWRKTAWLEGRIEDESGRPLRAQVLVDPLAAPANPGHCERRFMPVWPVTGPDGSFALEVPAGDLQLLVLGAGTTPVVLPAVHAVAGEDLHLGAVVVPSEPPRTLRGRVVSPDGPVAGAEVYPVAFGELGRLFLSALNTGPFPRTVSGPDGTFELGGLPADEVVVMAYHRSVGASDPWTLAAGDADLDGAQMTLHPGTADGRTGWMQGVFFKIDEQGLVVEQLVEGSPAYRAGLRVGDRPLEVDGCSARWFENQRLFTALDEAAGGRARTLRVAREGEDEPVTIRWAEAFED